MSGDATYERHSLVLALGELQGAASRAAIAIARFTWPDPEAPIDRAALGAALGAAIDEALVEVVRLRLAYLARIDAQLAAATPPLPVEVAWLYAVSSGAAATGVAELPRALSILHPPPPPPPPPVDVGELLCVECGGPLVTPAADDDYAPACEGCEAPFGCVLVGDEVDIGGRLYGASLVEWCARSVCAACRRAAVGL